MEPADLREAIQVRKRAGYAYRYAPERDDRKDDADCNLSGSVRLQYERRGPLPPRSGGSAPYCSLKGSASKRLVGLEQPQASTRLRVSATECSQNNLPSYRDDSLAPLLMQQ